MFQKTIFVGRDGRVTVRENELTDGEKRVLTKFVQPFILGFSMLVSFQFLMGGVLNIDRGGLDMLVGILQIGLGGLVLGGGSFVSQRLTPRVTEREIRKGNGGGQNQNRPQQPQQGQKQQQGQPQNQGQKPVFVRPQQQPSKPVVTVSGPGLVERGLR